MAYYGITRKERRIGSARDCRFCNEKQSVHPTYHFEGDYGHPYICYSCMKDQQHGRVWPHIPMNAVALDTPLPGAPTTPPVEKV